MLNVCLTHVKYMLHIIGPAELHKSLCIGNNEQKFNWCFFTNHSPLLKVLNLFWINFLTYSEKKETVQDSKLSLLYVTSGLLKDNARKGKVFKCSSITKIIKELLLTCYIIYRLVFTRKIVTFLSCQLSKTFNIIYLNLNVKCVIVLH